MKYEITRKPIPSATTKAPTPRGYFRILRTLNAGECVEFFDLHGGDSRSINNAAARLNNMQGERAFVVRTEIETVTVWRTK